MTHYFIRPFGVHALLYKETDDGVTMCRLTPHSVVVRREEKRAMDGRYPLTVKEGVTLFRTINEMFRKISVLCQRTKKINTTRERLYEGGPIVPRNGEVFLRRGRRRKIVRYGTGDILHFSSTKKLLFILEHSINAYPQYKDTFLEDDVYDKILLLFTLVRQQVQSRLDSVCQNSSVQLIKR